MSRVGQVAMERRLDPLRTHQRRERQHPAEDENRHAARASAGRDRAAFRHLPGEGHKRLEEGHAQSGAGSRMRRREPVHEPGQGQQQREPGIGEGEHATRPARDACGAIAAHRRRPCRDPRMSGPRLSNRRGSEEAGRGRTVKTLVPPVRSRKARNASPLREATVLAPIGDHRRPLEQRHDARHVGQSVELPDRLTPIGIGLVAAGRRGWMPRWRRRAGRPRGSRCRAPAATMGSRRA